MKRTPSMPLRAALRAVVEDEINWGESEWPAAPVKIRQSSGDAAAALDKLFNSIKDCRACPLGATRIRFVFGTGDPHARLMFIGEGPGHDEDRAGEPFVGRAGQLLNKIIDAMKLTRAQVYIANTVKCHPMKNPSEPESRGNDRAPLPEEISVCLPYLEQQVDLIQPAVIVALGATATHALLSDQRPIGALRGTIHSYRGATLIPTYHPAALLRNPALKKDTWTDMKLVMRTLSKTDPGR